eukprot:scaffold159234_cov61-Attheya_sp.AAC.1
MTRGLNACLSLTLGKGFFSFPLSRFAIGVGPSEHRNQGCVWKEGLKGFSKLVWMAQSDRYS